MKVHLQGCSIGSLSDGYVGKVLDSALGEIVRDIDDRGRDGLPRKLTVQLTFVPQADGRCKIDTQVKATVPPMRPPETIAKLDRSAGGFVFNPDFAENPDQSTFEDLKSK